MSIRAKVLAPNRSGTMIAQHHMSGDPEASIEPNTHRKATTRNIDFTWRRCETASDGELFAILVQIRHNTSPPAPDESRISKIGTQGEVIRAEFRVQFGI